MSLKTALAWGMEHLEHVVQRCGWPGVVEDEIAGRMQEISKTPLVSSARRLAYMMPISWGAECSAYVKLAYCTYTVLYAASLTVLKS
jgi:hypothetical protein